MATELVSMSGFSTYIETFNLPDDSRGECGTQFAKKFPTQHVSGDVHVGDERCVIEACALQNFKRVNCESNGESVSIQNISIHFQLISMCQTAATDCQLPETVHSNDEGVGDDVDEVETVHMSIG